MMPFAVGATTLLGGSMFLELASKGSILSPDNSAELYALIMGAYAGAGELKGWLTKTDPRMGSDPGSTESDLRRMSSSPQVPSKRNSER